MTATISLPYQLPSRGLLYGGKIPDGNVTILPIRGEQEELLAGTADKAESSLIVLQHVTQQLVQTPSDFAFQDLLVTDWMACLLNLLVFSYTPTITLKPKCPRCGHSFVQTTSVPELECTTVEKFDATTYREPFTSKPLPRSGETVKFRLLRLRDLNRIQDYVQKVQPRLGAIGGNPALSYTLAVQILSVNDVAKTDLEIIRWAKNALAFDLRFLREQIESYETGYDLRPTFKCQKCEELFQVQLPLDFFRANASQLGQT
jgi:hypothetical protein